MITSKGAITGTIHNVNETRIYRISINNKLDGANG